MPNSTSEKSNSITLPSMISNNFRIDKNIADNFKALEDTLPKDVSKYVKAILFYMALNRQKDLFGFYKLDLAEFADSMGFDPANIKRFHKNPRQLTDLGNKVQYYLEKEKKDTRHSTSRLWRSNFENALYILSTQSFVNEYRYKTETKAVVGTKSIQFIEDFSAEMISVGKTKKVVYKYKPNPLFEESLKTYFLNANLSKINQLRKPRLVGAYLRILNEVHANNYKNKNAKTFSLREMSSILDIGSYSQVPRLKTKITKKFEKLVEIVGSDIKGLSLTWGVGNIGETNAIEYLDDQLSIFKSNTKTLNKSLSIPIITWDLLSKDEQSKKDSIIFKKMFNQELIKNLSQFCFSAYEKDVFRSSEEFKMKFFYDWFFSEIDLAQKKIKYQSTYLDIYKNTKSEAAFSDDYFEAVNGLSYAYKNGSLEFNSNFDTILLHLKNKESKSFNNIYETITWYIDFKTQSKK